MGLNPFQVVIVSIIIQVKKTFFPSQIVTSYVYYLRVVLIFLLLTAKQQEILVDWLNGILPELRLPVNASDDELRDILIDGSVLCQILNRLKPGSVSEVTVLYLDSLFV